MSAPARQASPEPVIVHEESHPSPLQSLEPSPSLEIGSGPYLRPTHQLSATRDPRISSTQSLVEVSSQGGAGKRRLLLIWIHGYMGSEVSFQSFPAHIHNAVIQKFKEVGNDTHTVHTKIYPRYESRYRIESARDNFSRWLAPHEDENTDTILLGHSLGGILAAEVALMPSSSSQQSGGAYRHRIVGTVNFDTPFLGLHIGVVKTGISSLFKPKSKSANPAKPELQANGPDSQATGSDSTLNPSTDHAQLPSGPSTPSLISADSLTSVPLSMSSSVDLPLEDPNYNPPYQNDVVKPKRAGWESALHFVNKHSDNLIKATMYRIDTQMQFGACVTDHTSLRSRYASIRALENPGLHDGKPTRFVNYYTACNGRPKRPKSAGEEEKVTSLGDSENSTMATQEDQSLALPEDGLRLASESPRISIEHVDDLSDGGVTATADVQHLSLAGEESENDGASISPKESITDVLELVGDAGVAEELDIEGQGAGATPRTAAQKSSVPGNNHPPEKDAQPLAGNQDLPPPPLPPRAPAPIDMTIYVDEDARKLAEKEYARQVKMYEQAKRDFKKAVKYRQGHIQKREAALDKQLSSEERKQRKAAAESAKKEAKLQAKLERQAVKNQEKERARAEKEQRKLQKEQARRSASPDISTNEGPDSRSARDRKFCNLAKSPDGQTDPAWVRVFLLDIDEIEAHCALFTNDGERYFRFVDEVSIRIVSWEQEP